nr:unnamed protein product [Callosobruchus chinensis]
MSVVRFSSTLIAASLLILASGRLILENVSVEVDFDKEPFELDEVVNGTFTPKGWNSTWISATAFIHKNEDGDIFKYDIQRKTSKLLLQSKVLQKYPGAIIYLSQDEKYFLFRYNITRVYRYSALSQYTLYEIATGQTDHLDNLNQLQIAQFGSIGHSVVYVRDNNIYYINSISDVQNPIQITSFGVPLLIYCGVPDWIYEEEVFASASAMWFSPNGTYLAFGTFFDENVTFFSYMQYGEPGEQQYPTVKSIKYPKVGSPNPIAVVYVYNFYTGQLVELQLPPNIDNKNINDYILFGLSWISDTEVVMISSNRVQNETFTVRCTMEGTCEMEDHQEESQGWIEPKLPFYNKDGTMKVEILPQEESDDRYFHIVVTDLTQLTKKRLTYGRSTVLKIFGWDEEEGLIYYEATVINKPRRQHVFAVNMDAEVRCLTCSMVVEGQKCTFATAFFAKTFKYYTKECQGPKAPLVVIENAVDPFDYLLWEDNEDLRAKLATKWIPEPKYLSVPIQARDGKNFTAMVEILLPATLGLPSRKKLPAVVETYAGPNTNKVLERYNIDTAIYLVSNREYIHIRIDGRGSGRGGLNKMFQVYRRLATVEIEDQIQVTKYLQQKLKFIDKRKTGIWGWSYGGFASSWALAKDSTKVFNFAVAVAPVTNFLLYDTMYTERFMGLPTPEDNEVGYNNTDLTRVAGNFRGRRYFLVHGNADDNVHYQNSMLLSRALELEDIDFKQLSYPDENHLLIYVRPHLYHTIDKYFARCFGLYQPPITSYNNDNDTFTE